MQFQSVTPVILLTLCVSSASYALEPMPMNPLNNQPPAQQQFISANDNAPLSPAPAPVNSAAPQVVHTDSIMPDIAKPAPTNTPVDNNAQLNQLSQDNSNFQAMMMSQMTALQEQNRLLNNQLSSISQSITQIQQQVIPKPVAEGSFASGLASWATGYQVAIHSELGPYLVAASAFFIVMLLGWLLMQSKAEPAVKKPRIIKEADELSIEFDYLASQEALPAKLDLARAYIVMEDYGQAKKVLHSLLRSPCAAEIKREAQKLLDEMTVA